jgi:hypothetical protein
MDANQIATILILLALPSDKLLKSRGLIAHSLSEIFPCPGFIEPKKQSSCTRGVTRRYENQP